MEQKAEYSKGDMEQGGRVEFQPVKQSEAHSGSCIKRREKEVCSMKKISQLQKARNAAFISLSTIKSGGR
jgi:hypothetical protein